MPFLSSRLPDSLGYQESIPSRFTTLLFTRVALEETVVQKLSVGRRTSAMDCSRTQPPSEWIPPNETTVRIYSLDDDNTPVRFVFVFTALGRYLILYLEESRRWPVRSPFNTGLHTLFII